MNKKEQAEMAALIKQAAISRALNWTRPVLPDLLPPNGGDRLDAEISGFVFNSYNSSVSPAWSSSVSHSIGYPSRKAGFGASQNSRSLYSTKLLALYALRHAVEIECATKLAGIDKQIDEEESK